MTPHQRAVAAYEVCGVRIDAYTLQSAVEMIIGTRAACAVHLCNAYTLSLATRDRRFSDVLARGDMNLPDGMPLVWLGRRLGLSHMADRVYGPDLMAEVIDQGRKDGLRHYLYGSTSSVCHELAARLSARYEGVQIVGAESPPFRPLTDSDVSSLATRLAASDADVVWVGLGTPKQDWFVDSLRSVTSVTAVAVGAAFDFHAGVVRQAPKWVRKRGLEWAFRLLTEPRRLWRRYTIGNAVFMWNVLRNGIALCD